MGSWPVNGASLEANPDLVDDQSHGFSDHGNYPYVEKNVEKNPLNPMNRSFYYRDTIGFSIFFYVYPRGSFAPLPFDMRRKTELQLREFRDFGSRKLLIVSYDQLLGWAQERSEKS